MPAANQRVPALFTVDQVAERLGVSTKQVRRLIASRELPHHRIGRLIRITDADLTAFIRSRRVGQPSPQEPTRFNKVSVIRDYSTE